MSKLDKYIKQKEQKEILEIFDNIFNLAIESNRNKEFYDNLKEHKTDALKRNLKGDELKKFVEPFIKALDDENLESEISKEDKEKDKAIWEDYELKVKRGAIKSTLNFMVKQFILKARNKNCNDSFVELVREKQKEAYKMAFEVLDIDNMLKELESNLLDSKYLLNANQIISKGKFDTLIKDLKEICEKENITINQYNSGEYGNEDSSLWSEIFELKNEAINQDVPQEIIERIILDLNNKKERAIKRIILKRDIKERKKLVEQQNRELYIANLTPRQLEIRERFLAFQQTFIGRCKREFWEILFEKKKEAMENEIDDENLSLIFTNLESQAIEYIKS